MFTECINLKKEKIKIQGEKDNNILKKIIKQCLQN